MTSDADPPDNVRHVSFGRQSTIAPSSAATAMARAPCRHRGYELDAERRAVQCGRCGAELDAFEVLLQYARRERSWRHWDGETVRKRAELAELVAEEKRTKARLRNASRKDARAAVEAERARSEQERQQIITHARELAEQARRIERLARRGAP